MFASVRSRSKLRRLIESWVEYRNTVLSEREPGSVRAAQEQEFLDLEARIASLLPIMTMSSAGTVAAEANTQSRAMTDLLNRFRSLDGEGQPSGREREEFERRWHESFLYLNKLKGLRPGKEKPQAARRPAKAPSGIPEFHLRRQMPGWWVVKLVFELAMLAGLVYALLWVLGLHRDPTGRLAFGQAKNITQIGESVAQILVAVWGSLQTALQPVIARYGTESTIVLLGALLVASGIWVFVRRA